MVAEHFNPHSRKGSDIRHRFSSSAPDDFNPHSRKGSDSGCSRYMDSACISIHTPARGVTLFTHLDTSHLSISIHTPARGVTDLFHSLCCFLSYFNPHSRKGSDYKSTQRMQGFLYFNPHSRKGSDGKWHASSTIQNISIHTPARGVTKVHFLSMLALLDFNPHSRKGSDGITP